MRSEHSRIVVVAVIPERAVAAEGAGGITPRVVAWKRANADKLAGKLLGVESAFLAGD